MLADDLIAARKTGCPGYLVRPFLKEAVCTHFFLLFYLKGISRAPCKVMNWGKQVRFRQIFVEKAARNV
jgi:hypothetical protein